MRFLLFRINLYTRLLDFIEYFRNKLVSKYIKQTVLARKGEQQ